MKPRHCITEGINRNDEAPVPERAISGLEGWVECFDRASLKGSVFAGGVSSPGEIEGHKGLAESRELGKSVK